MRTAGFGPAGDVPDVSPKKEVIPCLFRLPVRSGTGKRSPLRPR